MTDTQTSEWIEHDGKGMPVDGETLVLVRFRDGTEEEIGEHGKASFWHFPLSIGSNWDHTVSSKSDIVAYRVVKP